MSVAAPEPRENMGAAAPRIDGRLKVTGQARYPADVKIDNPAYAFLVTSTIGKGRIRALEVDRAKAVPGVIDILSHENFDPVEDLPFRQVGSTIRPLASPDIRHDGQIIAVVLAESFEAAREAAYQIKATYDEDEPAAGFDSPGVEIQSAAEAEDDESVDLKTGDVDKALAMAAVTIDARYETPTQHHNPIELFSTTCVWQGDRLTVHEPSQFVYGVKHGIAKQLKMDPDKVRVVSHYVGGAFGSKGSFTQRTALIAVAARRLGRPVKLVATRDQGFTIATYRAETRHHIRLGARSDGKLVAYTHEGWEVTSRPDTYYVGGNDSTARLYAYGAVRTKLNVVRADRNTPGWMRSPAEFPYVYALECAMDEMAVALGMDPIEFRRVNDTMIDSVSGKSYSSRSLMRCYDEASLTFGWAKRRREPGAMRDGDWLVGWGCASAAYPTHISPSTVRIHLSAEGKARVEVAAHDLGTGTYTVVAQQAAERLGLDLSAVTVLLGDTDLPPGPNAGGSNTTASVCSVVIKACEAIRAKLFRAAAGINRSPLAGQPASQFDLKDGRIIGADGMAETLERAFGQLGTATIEEYAEWAPPSAGAEGIKALYEGTTKYSGGTEGDKLMYAFGAEFVEVRVHARTGEIRVPRMVGAFAGGRVMNPRTARSQLMGGMIWGLSSALHEATEIDRRAARYVNDNIAEYMIPVNADIAAVEVILVPEIDREINPAGAKGLGELGNVGTAAAIANAVYHATGKRVRKLPIRIEDIL